MNLPIQIKDQQIAGEAVQTVNARELHDFLEVGKDFSTWIKDRIEKYDFVESKDYILCSPNSGTKIHGGHNRQEYYLSLDMAKELAMVERNDQGKQARQYFIECEKQAKAQAPLNILSDPHQLRNLLLQYSETTTRLQNEIQAQQPMVSFYQQVANAENTQSIQETAKVLKIGPNHLFSYLRRVGFLMRGNLPYQKYIDCGYFRVVETVFSKNQSTHINSRTLVTGKGLTFIQKVLQKFPI